MTLQAYLRLLPQFLVLLPAALLCYLPMRDQLCRSPRKTALGCLALFVPYCLLAAGLCAVAGLDTNTVVVPSFLLFFAFYRHTVRAELFCALSIFLGVCTLMTFPAQFAYAFDAWLHPSANTASFSVQAALFQLAVTVVLTAALALPCLRRYAGMVDRLSGSPVWFPLLAVHSVLFLFNMLMIPHNYATLYAGRAFPMFLALESVTFVLFLLIHVIFYHMARVVLHHAELTERARFLELQAGQYRALQNYMQQTRRLRHDFRHSVHILSTLAENGELQELKAHLKEYEQRWDAEVPAHYCANAALNALFHYYKGMADAAGVETHWQLDIPDPLTISELDLASLFGNLMENAIAACTACPPGQRRFALSVEVRQGHDLYIVSTNSFDGRISRDDRGYRSTKHGGQGTGLFSITTVAQKYGGSTRIHHTDREFCLDVMLRI